MTETQDKPKQVKLLVMREANIFEVKQITNSSWYIPGDHITRDTLKKCCEMKDWEVTVIDNNFLQSIIGRLPSPITITP